MAKVIELLPEIEGEESIYINKLLNDMNEADARKFAQIYKARRKDPVVVLILACIGFFGAAGIHRFFIGHIGMGILYFLTAGLCFVGTIVDLINYKNLAFEYNREKALEVLQMM
ncbi:MAG TPA: TM2 domain-containing protein [Balneolaceae bacterium]|nr:TM2 domain-containing protein [Balneolaceae bacterium]